MIFSVQNTAMCFFFRNGVEGFFVCGGLERFANKHQRLLPGLVDNKFGDAEKNDVFQMIRDVFLLVPTSVNDEFVGWLLMLSSQVFSWVALPTSSDD